MECSSCPIQPLVNAFVEANLERNMGRCQSKRLKEACKKLQESFQNVCLTCVDETNDNNPSNHGQTFYSLDSGHCQTTSGNSPTSHSDNNEVISRADWISSHASYDSNYYQDKSFRPYSGTFSNDPTLAVVRDAMQHPVITEQIVQDDKTITHKMRIDYETTRFLTGDTAKEREDTFQDEFSITKLPSAVEAIILREMNNFAALPTLHQMLICCLLAGRNLSDFARMGWLPKEIKKMLKPMPKDAKDVISAQTAHAIYQNICKRLPYFSVLARATKKRSKERIESQRAAIKEFQQTDKRMVEYLHSPSSFKSIGRPAINPHEAMNPVADGHSMASGSRHHGKKKAPPKPTKFHQESFL